jgi:hypothetical protein
MSTNKLEEIKQELSSILKGIDKTETESDEGWWETSSGAEFGKNKLKEVLNLIDEFYKL